MPVNILFNLFTQKTRRITYTIHYVIICIRGVTTLENEELYFNFGCTEAIFFTGSLLISENI